MGFIEEEYRVDFVLFHILYMIGNLIEERRGTRCWWQGQCLAQLAIEITPPQGGIATIREAIAGLGQTHFDRPQDTGLANTGFSGNHDVAACRNGFYYFVDNRHP
jgi:hypothetical protein